MDLRQALIEQSPSLALQRAAADEIARLDAANAELLNACEGALFWSKDSDDCPKEFQRILENIVTKYTGERNAT